MDIHLIKDILVNEAPRLVLQHIALIFISLFLSIIISVPMGIIFTRTKRKNIAEAVLNVFGIFQSIPSFAFIAIAMPLLGLGFLPAITALTVQSLLPILRGTMSGIIAVDKNIIEAARGMGMTKNRIIFEVELPLALPSIINGIKISAIYNTSAATLAGFIGAGGLGVLISKGLSVFTNEYIFVGATLGALIAIILDTLLDKLETRIAI